MIAEASLPTPQPDAAALNRIRVETAFSRFPIHRLARKGTIAIDIQSEPEFKWEVTYNTKHGQPGPLAYKVDTLIVNRRIDEAPRPLPEVIKLGSLREICRELGLADHDTESVKKAFHQNASAYITAKIKYKSKSGRERWGEIGYTRYSIVFTGEKLPDGSAADAVYIVINASHRDLLNHVEVRPLDYDYLMELAPGPQRFYELVSFQIYGAIASGRPRAKMLYSDYCKYAPQTRYPDFDHVKKQMYKIHVPHRESGYISKVDYQECIDPEGKADWGMLYSPGPKALAEFGSFNQRQVKQQVNAQSSISRNAQSAMRPFAQASLQLTETETPLVSEMVQRGVTPTKASELASNCKPGQNIMEQLEYVDQLIAKAPRGKFHNPSGFYVRCIEENIDVPSGLRTDRRTRQSASVESGDHAVAGGDYDRYCHEIVERFIRESLIDGEYQAMFEKARLTNREVFKTMSPAQLDIISHQAVRMDLRESGRIRLLSVSEFKNQVKSTNFDCLDQ